MKLIVKASQAERWWIIDTNRECQVTKVHAGTHESFGHKYQVGDIVGCFIDVADRTISKSAIFPIIRSAGPPFFEFSRHYCCLCLYMFFFHVDLVVFSAFPCPKIERNWWGFRSRSVACRFLATARESVENVVCTVLYRSSVHHLFCLFSPLSEPQSHTYTRTVAPPVINSVDIVVRCINRKVDVSWFAHESWTEILNWWNFVLKEEKVYSGTAETFGKQWQVGDVVGVFLDLIDRTISKTESFKRTLQLPF